MPRVKRTLLEIEEVKKNILKHAVTFMNKVGFEDFTMRGLAHELGVTAPTIYGYYKNKDELYLSILTEGFSMLHERYKKAYGSSDDPVERIQAIFGAYVDFGLEYTNFYNLMYTWQVPKYNDYIGTSLEPAAKDELRTSLQITNLSIKAIKECAGENYTLPEKDVRFLIVYLWSALHGFTAGLNNELLNYVHKAPVSLKTEILNLIHSTCMREIVSRRVRNKSRKVGDK